MQVVGEIGSLYLSSHQTYIDAVLTDIGFVSITCQICKERVKRGFVVTTTTCKHAFHHSCFKEAFAPRAVEEATQISKDELLLEDLDAATTACGSTATTPLAGYGNMNLGEIDRPPSLEQGPSLSEEGAIAELERRKRLRFNFDEAPTPQVASPTKRLRLLPLLCPCAGCEMPLRAPGRI